MRTLSRLTVAFTLILAPLSGFASNDQLELKHSSPIKIVSGVKLPAGERPWMVSLQSNSGDHSKPSYRWPLHQLTRVINPVKREIAAIYSQALSTWRTNYLQETEKKHYTTINC